MSREVILNIPTSLAWLKFRSEVSTGTDPDTRPGLGFVLERYPDVDPTITTHGVISRQDAQELHNLLGDFLAKHPPEKTS